MGRRRQTCKRLFGRAHDDEGAPRLSCTPRRIGRVSRCTAHRSLVESTAHRSLVDSTTLDQASMGDDGRWVDRKGPGASSPVPEDEG